MAELIALAKQKPGDHQLRHGGRRHRSAHGDAAVRTAKRDQIRGNALSRRPARHQRSDWRSHRHAVARPSILLPAYRDGKVTMLSIGSGQRLPQLANVPATAETVPGYEASVSFGLYAQAAMPPRSSPRSMPTCSRSCADPAFQERFFKPQLLEAMPGTPDAFARDNEAESAEVGKGHRRCEADGRLTWEERQMMTWLGRLILFAALLASSAASAQTYPSRTVTIVVTSAAGAATDVLTRAVAPAAVAEVESDPSSSRIAAAADTTSRRPPS